MLHLDIQHTSFVFVLSEKPVYQEERKQGLSSTCYILYEITIDWEIKTHEVQLSEELFSDFDKSQKRKLKAKIIFNFLLVSC